MINAEDVYMEVLGKVNKEESGYLTTDLFNRYGRDANRFVFNDYLTRLQNPQTAAAEKQKLEDRLAPFDTLGVQPASKGIFTLPPASAYFRSARLRSDGGQSVATLYALTAQLCEAEEDPTINVADITKQIESLMSSSGQVGITLLDHDQVGKRMQSAIPGKRPSLAKPVMERVTVNGVRGFQIYPAEDVSVYFYYYRRPALPSLTMTPDQFTGLPIYNGTVGFEWEEEAIGDVVNKIATDFATYIREGGLFQMIQAEPKT